MTKATGHDDTRHLSRKLALLCAFAFLPPWLTLPAVASEWQIKPYLHLSEGYSTNISRAPIGQERGDWVTQINPSLELSLDGPRLELDAQYQMNNSIYAANARMNNTRHELRTSAHGKLYEELLFVDGKATLKQYNTSPLGMQTFNALNTRANLADVRTLSVSPYLRARYHGLANGEIRYTLGSVSSTAFGLSNNRSNSLSLNISSGHAFTALRWIAYYSKQQSSYSGMLNTVNSSNYGTKFNYMITPRLSLDASTGHEKSDYVSVANPSKGATNMAGFTWVPSLRTHIDLQAGRRAFGPSLAFNIKHRSRKTLWDVAYTEDITTTQRQFQDNAGLTAPPISPINFFSNQFFLQKLLIASLTVTGHRNDLAFSLFNATRDAQTGQNLALQVAGVPALGNRSRQRGGSATWNSRLSPRLTGNLTASYARNDFPASGISSQERHVVLSLTTKLQADLSYSLSLRHNQHESNLTNFNSRENAIAAVLMMQF